MCSKLWEEQRLNLRCHQRLLVRFLGLNMPSRLLANLGRSGLHHYSMRSSLELDSKHIVAWMGSLSWRFGKNSTIVASLKWHFPMLELSCWLTIERPRCTNWWSRWHIVHLISWSGRCCKCWGMRGSSMIRRQRRPQFRHHFFVQWIDRGKWIQKERLQHQRNKYSINLMANWCHSKMGM